VSSYLNGITLCQGVGFTPNGQWAGLFKNTAAYLGTDWMACFDCEPSYYFMKGLNSEGTPKVMQFSANYGG
jgi:hypothetical protein